jgi:acetyl esterase/lipase
MEIRPRPALAMVLCGLANALCAQRYATEVFNDTQLTITPDVPFGVNIDFMTSDFTDPDVAASEVNQLQFFVTTQEPIPQTFFDPESPSTVVKLIELRMDVYQPDQAVDCEQARPLFIYLPTGSALPPPLNGSPNGTRKDSSVVEICKRMARRGYVAVSLSYRSGWDPLAPDPQTRRGTLLNAIYRAVHDLKQGIRALKGEAGLYRISAENVIVCGEGTGGYIALAAATLDEPSELFIEKFIPDQAEPDVSYVDTTVVGNIDGFNGQLCLYRPNGFDGDFAFCVNIGGALADTSWLAPGDVPMVSFHPIFDRFAPFTEGMAITSVTGEDVVPVHGPNLFQQLVNTYGNNASFAGLPDGDPFTDRARDLYGTSNVHIGSTVAINTGVEGLFPFVTPDWPAQDPALEEETYPWNWWDPESPLAQVEITPGITTNDAELASDPDMSPEKARAYIDTIMGYLNPRIIAALGLSDELIAVGLPCDDANAGTFDDAYNHDCLCTGIPIGVEEAELNDGLSVRPVPMDDQLRVSSGKGIIRAYELYDATGRRVRTASVNASQFTIHRNGLQAGAYFLTVRFADGSVTRKVALD